MGNSTLNISVAKAYVPYQDLENKHLLAGLLDQPSLFVDHIRRYSTSLTTQMIFGFRTIATDDPKLIRLYHVLDELTNIGGTLAGAVLEVYPALRKLPDFMWPVVQRARRSHREEKNLFMGHWLDVKKAASEGMAKVRETKRGEVPCSQRGRGHFFAQPRSAS